ncbi:MAG TPA: DUF6152 family protein [Gammaproteobacteria bacterium]|nr:DUF6152 family protein [Gammaproteobacteria bacterium]
MTTSRSAHPDYSCRDAALRSSTRRLRIAIPLYLCAVTSVASSSALAHHSSFAFDTERTLTISGTVTEWFWANPHCLLKLDVISESGETVKWVAETQAPANMIDAGWRKNDLRPGDVVTVTLRPARNGNPVGAVVNVELTDGRMLQTSGSEATGDDYHLSGAPTD